MVVGMILTVRNLKPGQQFMLKRTGQWFIFIEKQLHTPSGMRHVVAYDDPFNLHKRNGSRTTLHHSCHVILNTTGEPYVTNDAN